MVLDCIDSRSLLSFLLLDVTSGVSYRPILEKAIIKFQAIGDRKISQKNNI